MNKTRQIFNKILKSYVLNNSGSSFIIQIFGAIIRYGFHLILIKALRIEVYGALIFIQAWPRIFSPICGLGFSNSILRYVPSYISTNKWKKLNGYLLFAILSTLFTSLIIGSVAGLIFYMLNTDYEMSVIFLAFLLLPISIISQIQVSIFKAIKKVKLSFIFKQFFEPLLLLTITSILMLWGVNISLLGILIMIVGISVTIFFISTYYVYKYLNIKLNKGFQFELKKWIQVTFPMAFSDIGNLIINRIDVILIGSFLDEASVGIYNIVARTTEMLDYVLISINSTIASLISNLFVEENTAKLKKLFYNSRNLVFYISIMLGLLVIVLIPKVLGFIADIRNDILLHQILIIFVLAKLVSAYAGSSGIYLNLTGNERVHMYINLASAFVLILGNLSLLPLIGLVGAPISYFAAISLSNLIKKYFALKQIHSTYLESFKMLFQVKMV